MIDANRHAPVATATLHSLVDTIEHPRATAASIGAVVDTDPGLLSRVLSLANSAFFGVARTVDDATTGVRMLGTETVRTLAVSGATGLLDSRCGLPGVRDHALEAAAGARLLATRVGIRPSTAFTAGLLHDLGELLLWQEFGDEYRDLRTAAIDHRHQREMELDRYGTDHAALASEHLFIWRLPDQIVDAVAEHHDPHPQADPLTLLVAAADELTNPDAVASVALDLLGLTDEVPDLRAALDEHAIELSMLLAAA